MGIMEAFQKKRKYVALSENGKFPLFIFLGFHFSLIEI